MIRRLLVCSYVGCTACNIVLVVDNAEVLPQPGAPEPTETVQTVETLPPTPCGITPRTYSDGGWKITLPVNADGALTGDAHEVFPPALGSYAGEWLVLNDTSGTDACPDLYFVCPAGGATTPNARFARTELRHLTDYPWDAATEMKVVFSVQPPAGTYDEDVVVLQIHAVDERPEFKVVWTTGRRLLRILYTPREGVDDDAVGVLLSHTVQDGDEVPIRIRRTADELQAFLGDNVDGDVPDWSSDDDDNRSPKGTPSDFARFLGDSDYYWKAGNYYQVSAPVLGADGEPLTTEEGDLVFDGEPALTIAHHEGSWASPRELVQ
ncbi:MAG: polysaccharide lyase family 7 protein [Myxococcales bacterium]|nr:polysaccharide lyase family 7 protein [Myxococcales bacterium]